MFCISVLQKLVQLCITNTQNFVNNNVGIELGNDHGVYKTPM